MLVLQPRQPQTSGLLLWCTAFFTAFTVWVFRSPDKAKNFHEKLIPFLYVSTQNDTVPHPCLPRWLLIIHSSCYQLQQPLDENPAYMVAQMVRSPGEGNGNLCQYSCLENSMDRRVWRAIAHGVAKSQTG